MFPNIYPIYLPRFLGKAEAELQRSPPRSLADARTQLRELAIKCVHPLLPDGLAADLWALQQTDRQRPALRVVTPPLVLVAVTDKGHQKGRLARLEMEWIEGDGCTGSLYPHQEMSGVMHPDGIRGGILTDAEWDGSLTAALGHAKENGFGIPQNADVRWRVRLVNEADAYAMQNIGTAGTELWKPLHFLNGRSAGAAFLIGLVYLGQRASEGTAIAAEMRRKVISLLPLLVLPTLPNTQPFQELGATERPKLDVLERHLANLTLIFPDSHAEGIAAGAMLVPHVAALVQEVVKRINSESVPDTIPPTLRAAQYVGAGPVDALVAALRQPGAVVVHGPAGIGKTARVLEAVRRLVTGESAFPGGRLYINLYNTAKSASSLHFTVLESVVRGLGKTPEEDVEKLQAQARALLADRRVLVLLEGAENVPEAGIAEVLAPFGGNTHIVWLTRRATDAQVQGLDGWPAHELLPLSPADSCALLCYHAGLDATALDEVTRSALDSIADDASHTPQLLVWAGRAIEHDALATPAQIAAEIHADPLAGIADPGKRGEANARRFLERSLAVIRPTAEYPALDATARRLFAALAAFHPAHGASANLWALAAGLDAAEPAQRREFGEARRALLSLRLVRLHDECAHPVHALAGTLAAALWREQPDEMRDAALSVLAHTTVHYLSAPRPPDLPSNAPWLAATATLARHWEHWTMSARFDPNSHIAASLLEAWVELLQGIVHPQPCLALKDAGWNAIRMHDAAMADAHPDEPKHQRGLSVCWRELGNVSSARQDWTGAERAYAEALKFIQSLVRAHPDDSDCKCRMSECWDCIADVCSARRDWTGAEQAYAEALKIEEALANKHYDDPDYRARLSTAWHKLGSARGERWDWAGADQAYTEAFEIDNSLAQAHPNDPKYQARLSDSWARLGDVRRNTYRPWEARTETKEAYAEALKIAQALTQSYPDDPENQTRLSDAWDRLGNLYCKRRKWSGAGKAYAEALKVDQALARTHPNDPNYQHRLSESWDRLVDVCVKRRDWTGAERACAEALEINQALERAHPDVPKYQSNMAFSWDRLGDVCNNRRDWTSAERACAEALKIYQALGRAHPDVPAYQYNIAFSWGRLAGIASKVVDWPKALQRSQYACTTLERQVAATPGVLQYAFYLMRLQCFLAIAASKAGKLDLACSSADASLMRNAMLRSAVLRGASLWSASKVGLDRDRYYEIHRIRIRLWRLRLKLFVRRLFRRLFRRS